MLRFRVTLRHDPVPSNLLSLNLAKIFCFVFLSLHSFAHSMNSHTTAIRFVPRDLRTLQLNTGGGMSVPPKNEMAKAVPKLATGHASRTTLCITPIFFIICSYATADSKGLPRPTTPSESTLTKNGGEGSDKAHEKDVLRKQKRGFQTSS